MGVLMWPVMVFYTNSTIHMVAHGAWAETMMLAGAAELGLVRGKLHNTRLAAGDAAGPRRLRERRSWCTSRTAGTSPAPPSCTTCWAGRRSSARSSRSSRAFRRRSLVLELGLRAHVRRARRVPLLRPRRGADLRAPFAARRGAAPMRRCLLGAALAALALPARRLCARDARPGDPVGPAAPGELAGARAPALRPERERASERDPRLHGARSPRLRSDALRDGPAGDPRTRPRASTRRATRCAGPRSRRTGTSIGGVYTFGVRHACAAGDGGLRRRRADHRGARRALALLPRARPDRRRPRFPAADPARAASPGDGTPLLPRAAGRRGRRAPGRDRRVPAAGRGRAAAAVREVPLRRPRADRERDALRHRVRRDDARVRASERFRLPLVADRARSGCSGRRSCSRSGSPQACRSRATPRSTRDRPGSPSSPTGRTWPRPRSGSAASCSWRSWSGRSSRSCGAARSWASRASRPF